jgi:DNA-binding NtrC family response regulator
MLTLSEAKAARNLDGECGWTILVADAHSGVRDMLKRVLGDTGYTILVADDATVATRLLRAHRGPIDLLLAAGTTGPLSGPELAAWAATLRPDIKILLMVAGGPELGVRPGWRRIQKPFTLSALQDGIRDVLGLRPKAGRFRSSGRWRQVGLR